MLLKLSRHKEKHNKENTVFFFFYTSMFFSTWRIQTVYTSVCDFVIAMKNLNKPVEGKKWLSVVINLNWQKIHVSYAVASMLI